MRKPGDAWYHTTTMDPRVQPPAPSRASGPTARPGRWFEGLQWFDDRMLCNGWVYSIVEHVSHPRNEPGQGCFRFYKPRSLLDQYDAFLAQRPEFAPQRILEIGIWDGGSAALWFDLFRPHKHVAIDLIARGDSEYFTRFLEAHAAEQSLRTLWGVDQADEARLRAIVRDEFDGLLDLVIDDASHIYQPTLASFETLLPLVAPGGLYIVEDWAWEHWTEFQTLDHIWAAEESLTRLVHECVECAGHRASPIASITVMPGLFAVERSNAPLPADRPFRLREYISRRPAAARRYKTKSEPSSRADTSGGLTVFVISWHRQHDRAVAIAEAVRRDGCDVRIVYSDPDLSLVLATDCPAIRRPDNLFWGDKFAACLDRCDTDAMLFIQADCDCDDWARLTRRCRLVLSAVPQCAVWAPVIDGTPYSSDVATFTSLGGGLRAAAQTDGIVLGLTRPVLDRLRQAPLDGNLYGWGIDQLAVAAAYATGDLVVIDFEERVFHPPARGYTADTAHTQWQAFLKKLSPLEQEWHDSLWEFVAASVAVKARRAGTGIFLEGRMVSPDGPASTAELESRLAAARGGLETRCAARIDEARAAASAELSASSNSQ